MSAYQYSAFQLDAFQIDAPVLGDCEQDYVESGYVEAGYVCGVEAKPVVAGGGIGKKRKRVYIERDGELFLFDNASDAAAFSEATKVIEKAKASAKASPAPQKAVQKAQKVLAKAEPQKIDVKALESFIQSLQIQASVSELLAKNEMDMLLSLYMRLKAQQDEEDDIETLLLMT